MPEIVNDMARVEAGTALISLSGDIDLAMSAGLEFAAEEAILRALPVRVDLSEVTFMDSIGVGFLARLARAGSEAGLAAHGHWAESTHPPDTHRVRHRVCP